MKRTLIFILGLIFIAIVSLYAMNTSNLVHLNYAYSPELGILTQTGFSDQGPYIYIKVRLSSLILSLFVLGLIIGSGAVYAYHYSVAQGFRKYKRELEKASLAGAANASKVGVLEAKIKTLEKAFNTVVDERTKLQVEIRNLNAELDAINKNNN